MAKPELPWCPFDFGAFLADTAPLSASECGAYIRILGQMWSHQTEGCTLPDNDKLLAGWAGLSPAAWKTARQTLIDNPDMVYLHTKNGRVCQKRLQIEYQKALRLSATRREAVSKRQDRQETPTNDPQTPNKPDTNVTTNVDLLSRDMFTEEHEEREGCAAIAAAPISPNGKKPGRKPNKGKRMPEVCPAITQLYLDEVDQHRPGTSRDMAAKEWLRWHANHRAKGTIIKDFPASWRTWVMSPFWTDATTKASKPSDPNDLSCGGKAEVFGGPRLD